LTDSGVREQAGSGLSALVEDPSRSLGSLLGVMSKKIQESGLQPSIVNGTRPGRSGSEFTKEAEPPLPI
jgi:hypothetical protein